MGRWAGGQVHLGSNFSKGDSRDPAAGVRENSSAVPWINCGNR